MAHAESVRGRVLGLDPGERWIGVAVSDDDRRLALPLLTIDRRVEGDDGAGLIAERLDAESATLVVVGVPLNPEGEEDAQARRTVAQHQKRRIEEHALAAANILQRWLDQEARASRSG